MPSVVNSVNLAGYGSIISSMVENVLRARAEDAGGARRSFERLSTSLLIVFTSGDSMAALDLELRGGKYSIHQVDPSELPASRERVELVIEADFPSLMAWLNRERSLLRLVVGGKLRVPKGKRRVAKLLRLTSLLRLKKR
ncbi:MAG: hypothetical protein Kow0069_35030 [Promethearchaeota archaeon]